jgi:peptidoglycan biosynthesis protein MviN/MurJ (putative lipid II flippase)
MILEKLTSRLRNILNSPNKVSVFLLVFWSFASKGLGLIRESLTGRLTTLEAEMFNFASIVNENITTFLILGSIGIALLPQVIKLDRNNDKTKLNSFISWVTIIYTGMITAFCLIGIAFSEQLLYMTNNVKFNEIKAAGKLAEYILLNQIFLFAPIIFALKTVIGVFLNAKKSFKFFAADGVLSNVGSIIGLTILYSYYGIKGAAVGLLIGFSLALVTFIYDAVKHGFRFNLNTFEELPQFLYQALLLFLPRLLFFPALRTCETMVALLSVNSGEISSFRMAMNIQSIFYSLVLAVGSVFLPDLTKLLHEKGRGKEFWNYIKKYTKNAAIFGAIGTVATIIITPALAYLLRILSFGNSSSFLYQDNFLWLIIQISIIGSIAVLFQTVTEVFNRYYIAVEKSKIPLAASVTGNVISIVIVLLFRNALPITYLITIAFIFNNLILAVIFGYGVWQDYKNDLRSKFQDTK